MGGRGLEGMWVGRGRSEGAGGGWWLGGFHKLFFRQLVSL